MEGVRDLVRAHEKYGIKAATAFPSGLCPQVRINDKKFHLMTQDMGMLGGDSQGPGGLRKAFESVGLKTEKK